MRNRMEEQRYKFDSLETEIDDENDRYKENGLFSRIHSVSPLYAILLVILFLGLFGLVFALDSALPTPLRVSDQGKYPHRFIAELARNYLKGLTDLGPRIVGSNENEMLAVQYLQQQIENISLSKDKSKNVEVDFQTVSGSYYLDYVPYGSVNAYGNVQNIIVKLSSMDNQNNNSILVNAHFDSVPTSPGGSDDGINCAAMLEILRILSSSTEYFDHDVIFLFNGAEESYLQASHGFITQHQWAKNCKVVVNLEAAGGGGKITLFQTGPGHPWLVNKFLKVPHPTGQVTGEELFQSNLIPSDTDFRIFRDFGKIIGYDMAFVKNGYRYHTKYDGIDNIPLGSFQHVGDNALELIKNLINAPELDDLESQDQTKVIYYDFLGLYMVVYTMTVAYYLNSLTAIFCVVVALKCAFSLGLRFNRQSFMYIFINSFGILSGWVLALFFTASLGFLIDYAGFSMSWYRNPWIILGLYVVPILAACCSTIMIANKFCKKTKYSIAAHTLIQLNCVRLIWCIPIVVGTAFNIRSTHVIQMPVFLNCVISLVIFFSKLQYSVKNWQILHIGSLILPFAYLMYSGITLMTFIIPVTGRFGSNKNPELFIGFATLALTVLMSSFLVPLITLVKDSYKVLLFFLAVFLVFFIIVFTPLGFPYSGSSNSPAPQRFWVQHVSRKFYDIQGNIRKTDAGFFILNMDRNSPKSIEKYVHDFKNVEKIESICNSELYCGMPILHPRALEILNYSSWIPAEHPIIPEETELFLSTKENIEKNLLKLNFSVSGPTSLCVYFALQNKVTLKNFSLTDDIKEGPKWRDRTTYFINYAWGYEKTPLNFSLTVEVDDNRNNAILDIVVLGRYVNSKTFTKTPHYQQFLNEFPEWAEVTPSLGSLKMWSF